MSVLSTLGLLAAAVAARIKPKPIDVLESTIDDLKAELADARRELELERALTAELAQQQSQQYRAIPALVNTVAEQHSAILAQYNAQLAQQHQAAMQQNLQNAAAYGQGVALLGAQQMSVIDPEMWCNCTPSRAQVWAAHGEPA